VLPVLAHKDPMNLATAKFFPADDKRPCHGMQGLAGERGEERAHLVVKKIMRTDPGAAEECAIFRAFAPAEPEILAGERREMEQTPDAQDPADLGRCRISAAGTKVADNVTGDHGIAGACLHGDFPCIGNDYVAIPAGSNSGFCRDDRRPGKIQSNDSVALCKDKGGILPAATAQFENPGTGPEALDFWGCSTIQLASPLVCHVPRGAVIGHGAS